MNLRRVLAFFALHALQLASGRVAYDFSDGAISVLRTPLQKSFTCDSKAYGYYADISNGCQVFHICLPVTDADGDRISTDQFSFFCGNRTVFSQDSLQCVHEEDAYPCELSESIYELANSKFGTSEGIAIFEERLDNFKENRQEELGDISFPETSVLEFDDARENRISDEPQVAQAEEPSIPQFNVELPEIAEGIPDNAQSSGQETLENQEKTFDGPQGSDILNFEQGNQEPFPQVTFEDEDQGSDLGNIPTEQNDQQGQV